jgi:hypothetical protein
MTNRELDAYGHMNWTVGNEDWTACFDACRVGNKVEYHVVVDCESAGFTDTVEHRTVPATPDGIAPLFNLPGRYADICVEMYLNDPVVAEEYGEIEYEQCDREWRLHLQSLLLTATPDNEYEGDCSEEQSLDYFNRYIAGDR